MFRASPALRPRTAQHDPTTGVLTVRCTSVSGSTWAQYEYRDVPGDVAAQVTRSGPRLRAVLLDLVVDRYAVRRCGTPRWLEPPA